MLFQIEELWTNYVLNFEKLLEEVLKMSARETFQSIYRAFNGNGILGPEQLICVTLDTDEGKVSFSTTFLLYL